MSETRPTFGPLLDSWLETLDSQGFRIGTAERLSIHTLRLHVKQSGDVADFDSEFFDLVAPLVCTSGECQSRYRELLKEFLQRQQQPKPKTPGPSSPGPTKLKKSVPDRSRWIVVVFLLMVFGAIVGSNFLNRSQRISINSSPLRPELPPSGKYANIPLSNRPPRLPGPPPEYYLFNHSEVRGAVTVRTLSWSIMTLSGWILGWMAWGIFRRSPYLLQARTDREVEETVLFDPEGSGSRQHFSQLRIPSRALRRRVAGEGQVLDPVATLRQSLRSSGLFVPRYQPIRTTPEYVVLIDQRHFRDHFSRYATDLVRSLHDLGVVVRVVYFEESPTLGCWTSHWEMKPGQTYKRVRWSDLVQQSGGRRLLVFAEAAVAVHPATGQGRGWTTDLEGFAERAWLTPRMVSAWSSDEALVYSLGFLILPAVEESIAALGEWLGANRPVLARARDWPGTFPDVLRDDAISWVARQSPPPSDVVETLIFQLRYYLGPSRFQWLCGSAIFPAVSPVLTRAIGRELLTGGTAAAAREQSLGFLALSALPFFRHAHLPDWLRQRLIDSLSPENEERFRKRVQERLDRAIHGGHGKKIWTALLRRFPIPGWFRRRLLGWFPSRSAQAQDPATSKSGGEELARIAWLRRGRGMARDVVLVEFLQRNAVTRLAQKLPESWKRFFFRRGIAAYGLRPGLAIAVTALLLLSLQTPNLWARYGPRTTLSQALTNSLGMVFVPVSGTSVKFCIWETRVKDYEAFANAAGTGNNEWKNPKYGKVLVTPTNTCPVVNVSWEDAEAFCTWLTQKEHREGILGANQRYRLPTDLEWSAAVGLTNEAGTTPAERDLKVKNVYPWGTNWPPANFTGNYADESFGVVSGAGVIGGYQDGYPGTSPVGSYPSQPNGMFDLSGNVWEWCSDWWDDKKKYRVLRGGSWGNLYPDFLLSSYRDNVEPSERSFNIGFRVVVAGDEFARSGGH